MKPEAQCRAREDGPEAGGQAPRRRRRAVVLALSVSAAIWGHQPLHAGSVDEVTELLRAGQFVAAEAAARRDFEGQQGRRAAVDRANLPRARVLLDTLLANGRGAATETLALASSILRVVEAAGDADGSRVGALTQYAATRSAAGDYRQALATARRAVALTSVRPDGEVPRSPDRGSRTTTVSDDPILTTALARHQLGVALSGAGRHAEAVSALEASVSLLDTRAASDREALAPVLEDLVLALHRHGEYRAAAAPLERAMRLRDEVAPGHPARVRSLQLAAQQAWFEGRLIDARQRAEAALALAEAALHGEHPLLAASLRYLAGTLGELGDFRRSVALKRRALTIADRAFGPTHHLRAEYLHTLGVAEVDLGNYVTARDLLTRTLRLYQRRYGRHHQDLAAALSVLAEVHTHLGDYDRARRDQERVVAIHTRVGGATHPYVARGLVQLAGILQRQGATVVPVRLLRRALSMQEAALGATHRDVAQTLAALAHVLNARGEGRAALPLAVRAVATWDALGVADAPSHATVLMLAASISADQRRDDDARGYLERALRIRERALGTRHPLHAEARIALAYQLARHGESGSALRHAARGEEAARQHLMLMVRSLPERQALEYARSRPRGLDLLLSLAASTAAAVPEAFEAVIQTRAVVLDALAARNGASRGPATRDPLRLRLRAAQQQLANLLVRGPGDLTADAYAGVLADARDESERLEEAVAARGAASAARLPTATVDALRARLPDDAALVSFVQYGAAPTAPRAAGVRAYAAFVLVGSRAPVYVPLGTAHDLEALIARWRRAVHAEARAGRAANRESSRDVGVALRRRVWDPLLPHLFGMRRVLVVPDGQTALLPLAGLPTLATSYLIETGPSIHYLTAERDLLRDAPAASTGGLLAVGGAAFDALPLSPAATSMVAPPAPASPTGCGDFASVRFRHLDGARREVADVARLWTQASSGGLGPVLSLVGREAREDTVKRQASSYRVLHLATHGFFLDGRCASAAPASRPVPVLRDVDGLGPGSAARNPLLLSGLAFAGANHRSRAPVDGDDGILTAEEVAALSLSGTEWAVLSACESGVGRATAGEGVFGLRRAFHVAGVRTVIMSLWAVDDFAAREWMSTLYRGRFHQGLSSADAVHAASLSALRMRRQRQLNTSPFFWAGFVAAGDWR